MISEQDPISPHSEVIPSMVKSTPMEVEDVSPEPVSEEVDGDAMIVIDPDDDGGLSPAPSPAVYSWGRRDLGCLLLRKGDTSGGEREGASEGIFCLQRVGHPVVAVASSAYHTVAVTATGEVYACGQNDQGQVCGDGEASAGVEQVDRPRLVESLQNQSVAAVACGLSHTVCLTASGCVISFGGNDCGQLGHSADKHSFVPPKAVAFAPQAGLTHARRIIRKVACGDLFSLLLSTAGEVFGCGSASYLGNVVLPGRQLVVEAERVEALVGVNVRDIAAGGAHCLALCGTGLSLYAWGSNRHCALGVDSTDKPEMHEQTPVLVPLPEDVVRTDNPLAGISAGASHSLVWTREGDLLGCGSNKYGQLGGSPMPRISSFEVIALGQRDGERLRVSMASCGANHSIALCHFAVPLTLSPSANTNYSEVSQSLSPPAMSSLLLSSSVLFPLSLPLSLSLSLSPSVSLSQIHSTVSGTSSSATMPNTPIRQHRTAVLSFGANTFTQCQPASTASAHRTPEEVVLSPSQSLSLSPSLQVLYVAAGGDQSFAIAVPLSPSTTSSGPSSIGPCVNTPIGPLRPLLSFTHSLAPGHPLKRQFSTLAAKAVSPMTAKDMLALLDHTGHTHALNAVCELFSAPSLLSASFSLSPAQSLSPSLYDVLGLEECYTRVLGERDRGTDRERDSTRDGEREAAAARLFASVQQCVSELERARERTSVVPASAAKVLLMLWQCPLWTNALMSADLMLRLLRLCPGATLQDTLRANFGHICLDTDSGRVTVLRDRMLKPLLGHIDFRFTPNAQGQVSVDAQTVRTLCEGVAWIHALNAALCGESEPALLAAEDFHCERVSQLNEAVLLRDLLHYRQSLSASPSQSPGNNPQGCFLVAYPFLLSPCAKRRLMLAEAAFHQRMAQQQAFAQGLLSGSALVIPYFLLPVERDRDAMLQGTLAYLSAASPLDLKKPLKVIFMGEEGVDEGGVRKEFFQLLITQRLLSLDFGMFVSAALGSALWLNASNVWSSEEYTLIGVLLGLAVYNGVLLDVHFPAVLYKKMVLAAREREQRAREREKRERDSNNKTNSVTLSPSQSVPRYTLRDLDSVDPDLARGLRLMLESPPGDVETVFCRSFSVEWDEFGERRTHDLLPGGRDIAVTGDNREEFVRLYVQWLLHESVAAQFDALFEGFSRVVHPSQLVLFTDAELELLMTGTPSLDFAELEAHTQYVSASTPEGETEWGPAHPTVRWFWETVHAMCEGDKQALLQFITGCRKAPIGGLKNLGLKIQRMGPDCESLPTAHTCFNVLLLPQYSSAEKLRDRLLKAIQECEGFGLK